MVIYNHRTPIGPLRWRSITDGCRRGPRRVFARVHCYSEPRILHVCAEIAAVACWTGRFTTTYTCASWCDHRWPGYHRPVSNRLSHALRWSSSIILNSSWSRPMPDSYIGEGNQSDDCSGAVTRE